MFPVTCFGEIFLVKNSTILLEYFGSRSHPFRRFLYASLGRSQKPKKLTLERLEKATLLKSHRSVTERSLEDAEGYIQHLTTKVCTYLNCVKTQNPENIIPKPFPHTKMLYLSDNKPDTWVTGNFWLWLHLTGNSCILPSSICKQLIIYVLWGQTTN